MQGDEVEIKRKKFQLTCPQAVNKIEFDLFRFSFVCSLLVMKYFDNSHFSCNPVKLLFNVYTGCTPLNSMIFSGICKKQVKKNTHTNK